MIGDGSNGEHGVTHKKVTMITVVLDHETLQVALGLKDVTLGVAGMMLHEAAVQIDTMRRQAAAMELREQMLEAQKNAQMAEALRNRR